MKFGKHTKLAEALIANPKWVNGRFYQKFLAEAKLEGNITDETPSVDATLQILDQIIMGVEKYATLDFARQYKTDKASMSIPLGTYGAASEISSGAFTNSPKTATYADVDLDTEYGVEVTWTRAHLEDATWDVLAEQNEGAGYAIKVKLVELLADALTGISSPNLAGGAYIDIASDTAITWQEFLNVVGAVDVEGTGPADFTLVDPTTYWQLLALDEFTNVCVMGSDETIQSGIIKTTMGVTVVKISDLAERIVALNSKKACALVTRREIQVEPFENPEDNEYGFIASVRAKESTLHENAVAIGKNL